ncbi:MAG: TonB-dependent receptor plug domain-containing protein [Longimicrobiales bacterium]
MRGLHPVALLATGLTLFPLARAEAQVIRGIVVEAGARLPLADVEVALLAGAERDRRSDTTDSLGVFVITLPRAGIYTLRLSHPSYVTYETGAIEVGTAETVSLEVRLGQNVIPLEPLLVTVQGDARMAGFDQRRRSGGLGRFITREDIEARNAARATDLLRGIPGVTIRAVPRRSASLIEMRGGFGTCRPAIWVDGVLVEQYAGSTPDEFLAPQALEGVEVYTSFANAPAQFISGSCGVVLFWTRRGSSDGGAPWRWKRMLVGAGAAALLILLIR